MNLSKAVRKAGEAGLIARRNMKPGEAVTRDGFAAIYGPKLGKKADGRPEASKGWKVFWDLKPKLSWEDGVAEDWYVLPTKLTEQELRRDSNEYS